MLGCEVNSIQNRKLAADTSSLTSHIVLKLVGDLENKNNGNTERNNALTAIKKRISNVAKDFHLKGRKQGSSKSNQKAN